MKMEHIHAAPAAGQGDRPACQNGDRFAASQWLPKIEPIRRVRVLEAGD